MSCGDCPSADAGLRALIRRQQSKQRTIPPSFASLPSVKRCDLHRPDAVAAASWDSVIFDIPGHDSLQRVPTLEPLRGTRAHVGDLIDRSRTAAELVAALTGQG